VDSPTFLKRVCELTGLDKEHAERAVRATFVMLGTRIDPGEADDLAAQLPNSFGHCLRHEGEAARFAPSEFQRRVACVVPLANEQARDAIRAVFTVLAEAISPGELEDVLRQLSHDYGKLVGMPTGRDAQPA
jgi:uncharacterized protein (DUF2267 family)